MKMLVTAIALSLALPAVAHAEAAQVPKEKDCCEKMKAEGKKCCCDDMGHEKTAADVHQR
jgi:hypothetical protein